MKANEPPLFIEIQTMVFRWAWAIVVLVVAIACWGFIQQIVLGIPFGNNPASDMVLWIILIVIGIGLPLIMKSLKLTTQVLSDRIQIEFFPLHNRTVYHKNIRHVKARQYRPIREYGGWGIRWSPSNGMAYNISGDQGVQLELSNGKRLLIGSQRAEELASAIKQALGLSE